MLYILILWLIFKLCKRISSHCKRYPYLPEQTPETVYTVNIADYLPQTIPKEPIEPEQLEPPDDSIQEQIEQLDEIKDSYFAVLDAINREEKTLKSEYIHASDKRRSAIAAKLTALASKRASTLRTLQGLDAKQRKLSIT